jgi:hypothetical protein
LVGCCFGAYMWPPDHELYGNDVSLTKRESR